jgi:hypothetical protein
MCEGRLTLLLKGTPSELTLVGLTSRVSRRPSSDGFWPKWAREVTRSDWAREPTVRGLGNPVLNFGGAVRLPPLDSAS